MMMIIFDGIRDIDVDMLGISSSWRGPLCSCNWVYIYSTHLTKYIPVTENDIASADHAYT